LSYMDTEINEFLSGYNDNIAAMAQTLRTLVKAALPGATETLDTPARMVAYSYGQKYADLICVIIPSKKGLKLGFNRGTELADPLNLLEGTGKISRYVQIKNNSQPGVADLLGLLNSALGRYQQICK